MSTAYVFLFVCSAFVCHGKAMPGNGEYYNTKLECHQAARRYAKSHHVSLGRYDILCVERELPE